MGLIPVGLGPNDLQALRTLQPEVIRTLRSAAALLRNGEGKAECRLWFGDDSNAWMTTLSADLNRTASVLNTTPIEVVGTHWRGRAVGTSAAAQAPTGGWNAYSQMSRAQGRDFRIRLDVAWNGKPLYRPGDTPGLSKFHTIVHELTHLILNTDDVAPAYGEANCKEKAQDSPTRAKKNADNWAFFVDDFRKPRAEPAVTISIISAQAWKDKTQGSGWQKRSGDLRKVDAALSAYAKGASATTIGNLKTAFNNWYSRNPKERTKRNQENVVEQLRRALDALA